MGRSLTVGLKIGVGPTSFVIVSAKLIISNWKNHPESLAQAREILESVDDYLGSLDEIKEFSLVFCPPFIFVEEVAKILETSHLKHESFLGVQNIAIDDRAALTGEISGNMLAKLGVNYVIVGHSERRWKLGESDEMVNKKIKSALNCELTPIVCIGEKIRDGGYQEFIENQINQTFKNLTADEVGKCVIAYEPVWAISTNPNAKPDTPKNALESINRINNLLIENFKLEVENLPKVLYGGSVNSSNVADFFKNDQIGGVLIGSASIDKEEFIKILQKI